MAELDKNTCDIFYNYEQEMDDILEVYESNRPKSPSSNPNLLKIRNSQSEAKPNSTGECWNVTSNSTKEHLLRSIKQMDPDGFQVDYLHQVKKQTSKGVQDKISQLQQHIHQSNDGRKRDTLNNDELNWLIDQIKGDDGFASPNRQKIAICNSKHLKKPQGHQSEDSLRDIENDIDSIYRSGSKLALHHVKTDDSVLDPNDSMVVEKRRQDQIIADFENL